MNMFRSSVRRAPNTAWHALLLMLAAMVAMAGPSSAQVPSAAASSTSLEQDQRAITAATQFRIGAGDVIRINVYQNPDLSVETRVTDTGVISYPLLGAVDLVGLTVGDAEDRLASLLKAGDFVKTPQVSIVVMQVRANQVNVLGHVGRPGRVPLDVAGIRLTEIIARSGGVSDGGSEVIVITGIRDGKPFLRNVNLPRIFTEAGQADDMVMLPGDSVWVDRTPIAYLYGEVQRPGQVRLERGMSIMQALATAGGLTQRGTQRGLLLHRRDADGRVQSHEPSMTEPLLNGDVLYVRESLF